MYHIIVGIPLVSVVDTAATYIFHGIGHSS